MFITKKHLSRRTFLHGAGVAVGLPLLDAMVPAWTALAQTAASPQPRLGFMYLPHGAIMDQWTPAAPLPMESDPRKLCERLFGQGDTPQERKAIAKQYSSILDLVTQEAADLRKSLDAPDRAKLGDYLESVREIERRVQKMEEHDL